MEGEKKGEETAEWEEQKGKRSRETHEGCSGDTQGNCSLKPTLSLTHEGHEETQSSLLR